VYGDDLLRGASWDGFWDPNPVMVSSPSHHAEVVVPEPSVVVEKPRDSHGTHPERAAPKEEEWTLVGPKKSKVGVSYEPSVVVEKPRDSHGTHPERAAPKEEEWTLVGP